MNVTRHLLYLIAGLAAMALGGCVMLAPTDPYRPIASSSPLPSTSAHQPEAEGATTTLPLLDRLDLENAIAIALERNPDIAAMGHEAVAARARRDGAWGAMLPSLSAEGAYTYHLDDQRLVPVRALGETGTFSDSIVSGDLVLRLPLFAGGRLIHEARATRLLQQAAEHRLSRTREQLIFNVTSVYFGMLAQEKRIDSLAFSQEALESHLRRVQDLIAADKAAEVDRLRTEVRLADVRQKIVLEKNMLAIQRQLLANLMGIPSTSPALVLLGELDADTTRTLSMEQGIAMALAHRPDYRAAHQELEAQARRVDIARAGHSPSLHLFGAYGGRAATNSSEADDVGRVGIGLEMPLFQGGRLRARVQEERAKLAAAQERLRKLELQIQLEVETALLNLGAATERAQTLQKSIEQAEESLRIERQKYELGMGAIVDVLDAQSALLEAETNYYSALADCNVAQAQIDLAVGEREL